MWVNSVRTRDSYTDKLLGDPRRGSHLRSCISSVTRLNSRHIPRVNSHLPLTIRDHVA
jgi:hypothetical protein